MKCPMVPFYASMYEMSNGFFLPTGSLTFVINSISVLGSCITFCMCLCVNLYCITLNVSSHYIILLSNSQESHCITLKLCKLTVSPQVVSNHCINLNLSKLTVLISICVNSLCQYQLYNPYMFKSHYVNVTLLFSLCNSNLCKSHYVTVIMKTSIVYPSIV